MNVSPPRPRTRRRSRVLVLATVCLAALALAAGCSSGSAGGSASATTTGSASAPCERKVSAPRAAPVQGSEIDWDVTSFDGTRIRAHWMPTEGATAGHAAPTVLMGPGWGMPGATNAGANPADEAMGSSGVKGLLSAGYNVLTWDPRGFGDSDGVVTVDSPDNEGRDVQTLVDWVSKRPGVLLDRPGDPRMGMVGGSYGGGIQFVVAAGDCRVDAIVPTIAWHSLGTSLYKAETVKSGWSGLLMKVAADHHLDPHVLSADEAGTTTGVLDAEDRQWFLDRGPGDLVGRVKAPTLLIQGTVDTLFTLDEAVTNYEILRKAGTPVHMLWYCGGHGACLTDAGDPKAVDDATLAWLDRWVKGDRAVDTGAAIDVIDQNGHRYTADSYPFPSADPLRAEGTGRLKLVAEGGSGPLSAAEAGRGGIIGGFAAEIFPTRAANAVDVPVTSGDRSVVVVGAPKLSLTYAGTAGPGDRPTRVFAQLVDESTGFVVGNQVTPIDVVLDGKRHTTEVPLEIVAQAMPAGSRLTLQVVATTTAYAQPRLGGEVRLEKVAVSLPVAKGLKPGA